MKGRENAFGEFLRKLIKQSGMTQASFYTSVEITKPYFYDILSGKVNPPPPEIQYKMLNCLSVTDAEKNEFLNLAAEGRSEIPADIAKWIFDHPQSMDQIRNTLATIMAS